MITLTPDSLVLFKKLADDTFDWDGIPILPDLNNEQVGNLTDLKKKGLLSVEYDDNCPFVIFTELSYSFCESNNIDILKNSWA